MKYIILVLLLFSTSACSMSVSFKVHSGYDIQQPTKKPTPKTPRPEPKKPPVQPTPERQERNECFLKCKSRDGNKKPIHLTGVEKGDRILSIFHYNNKIKEYKDIR